VISRKRPYWASKPCRMVWAISDSLGVIGNAPADNAHPWTSEWVETLRSIPAHSVAARFIAQ
jgi:hypothetical protein